MVELAFWNFDALFQPQDHPARDMHDTFYLAEPRIGDLPEVITESVKRAHEDGGKRVLLDGVTNGIHLKLGNSS